MIDYNTITNNLVRVAVAGVGSLLSTTGSGANERPSVIQSRQGATKPDYPYIMVDTIDTTLTNGPLGSSGIDVDENNFYESIYTIQFQYTVYGTDKTTGAKAQSIAHQLESYFLIPRVRDDLCASTQATLEQTFKVIDAPQQISASQWLEVAFFTFTMTIVDRVTDDTSGTEVFDTIHLDGDLFRDDDDIDPLEIDIDVTSV